MNTCFEKVGEIRQCSRDHCKIIADSQFLVATRNATRRSAGKRLSTANQNSDVLRRHLAALTDLVPELLRQPCLEIMCLTSQWNR
jgi:hypothetical protein